MFATPVAPFAFAFVSFVRYVQPVPAVPPEPIISPVLVPITLPVLWQFVIVGVEFAYPSIPPDGAPDEVTSPVL